MSRVFIILSLVISSYAFSKEIKLDVDKIKSEFPSQAVTVFNIHTKRLESYIGINFNLILKKYYGDEWRNFFAIKFIAKDKYHAHVETYKFMLREAYLVYKSADKKSFSRVEDYGKTIQELGPLFLVFKENYKKQAAKRQHHWAHGILAFDVIKRLPEEITPYSTEEDITWGMKNYFKQCIHCHKINGVGGEKSFDLTANLTWKSKSREWLYKYIENPFQFKKDSQMDVFPKDIDIKETRINNIIDYLYDMSSSTKTAPRKRSTRSKALKKMLKENRL